jgi:hypothetical protein
LIQCECTSRQTSAGTTRSKGNFSTGQFPHDCGSLFGRRREDYSARSVLVLRQSVALVYQQLVGR